MRTLFPDPENMAFKKCQGRIRGTQRLLSVKYRKIPKISAGTYIFSEALFEGAYIRRGLSTEGNFGFKTDWISLIVGSQFIVFALFYFVFKRNFPSTSPRGLIFGGAI